MKVLNNWKKTLEMLWANLLRLLESNMAVTLGSTNVIVCLRFEVIYCCANGSF